MKKSMTVLFVLIAVNLLSQTNDTIILNTDEIIPCQIHDISKSGLVTYYHINSDGDSAMAQKVTESIKEIKYGSGITMKYESGILVKQIHDSSIQSSKKQRLYNTWIRTMYYDRMKKIYIYEIKKEEITVVSKKKYEKGKPVTDSDLAIYAVDNIKDIYTRRKGDVWLGACIGGATGFILGGIIGSAMDRKHGTDHPQNQKMAKEAFLVWGAVGLSWGFAIGSIIGSIEKHHHIDGNQISFDKVREGLKKRSIRYYY
jgi:hypothetical protein